MCYFSSLRPIILSYSPHCHFSHHLTHKIGTFVELGNKIWGLLITLDTEKKLRFGESSFIIRWRWVRGSATLLRRCPCPRPTTLLIYSFNYVSLAVIRLFGLQVPCWHDVWTNCYYSTNYTLTRLSFWLRVSLVGMKFDAFTFNFN